MTMLAGWPGSRRSRLGAPPAGQHRRARAGHQAAPGRLAVAGWPVTAVVTCGMFVTAVGLAGLVMTGGTDAVPFGLHAIPAVAAPHGPATPARGPAAPPRGPATPARGPAAPLPAPAVRPTPRPVDLIIPAIGVRTRLITLGTTARGALQVPATTAVAGWYTGSPAPGAIGSAVIAGHVDSYLGPGVFFRLRLLRPRDHIYVLRSDGTLAVFRVTSVRSYLKSRFPTGAVYGPAPVPQLRLITCGGPFDQASRSYLRNIVVYAAAAG
jgi:sortase (surface protein transpeptidase)